MMPLSMVNEGEPQVIRKVGGKEETRKFLENLGFVQGATVTVVSEIGGNMIVNVKDFPSCHWKRYGESDHGLKSRKKESSIMKTLRQVGVGQTVTVKRLHGEGPVKRRIMDMGITKGVSIYVRKVAPLGDPIEVTVRDYELSLRKVDAEMIEVE